MVSFDLDALNQGEAPGVSAPNAAGLSSALWLAAAYVAGRSRAVTSADVVELNPRVDRDDQTARVAALTVWWLLRGCAERS
jgi:formiminoglutamase